jgi:DNA processing protein
MTTTVLAPGDPAYPRLLAAVPAPPRLWVRGALLATDALAVAVVGSRRASAYGEDAAGRLAYDLAARGVTIVSGMARGIDTAAHRGALAAGGRTVAVLGCGVDVVYPPENRRLAGEIEAHGAVVSQFPPGVPPLRGHFPARNRTLAGLALGVVVVEATERSGALITAGHAGDLGREVFAIPGKITSPASRGSHGLIRDGATLIQSWSEVTQELPEPYRSAVRSVPDPAAPREAPAGPVQPEPEAARLLQLLSTDEPQHIERLIARSGVDAARASAMLTALELEGWARQLGGQRWVAAGTPARRG